MKYKVAIFRCGKDREKEFLCFDEVECEKDLKGKNLDNLLYSYHECDCDGGWNEESEELCECETWWEEVAQNIERYDWYTDQFYTKKQWEDKKEEERKDKIENLQRKIENNNGKILKIIEENFTMEKKIEKLELEKINR